MGRKSNRKQILKPKIKIRYVGTEETEKRFWDYYVKIVLEQIWSERKKRIKRDNNNGNSSENLVDSNGKDKTK